jgi:hypothetical protein
VRSFQLHSVPVNYWPNMNCMLGTVKKVGALKVIHEKFKKKSKTEEEASFRYRQVRITVFEMSILILYSENLFRRHCRWILR